MSRHRNTAEQQLVDPRYQHVVKNRPDLHGKVLTWTKLNGNWAVPGKNYGQEILMLWREAQAPDGSHAALDAAQKKVRQAPDETITLASANTDYDSRSSCQAIIKKSDLSLVSGCRSTIIPTGIRLIQPYAFKSIDGLQRIVIPGDVMAIGTGAFAGCTGVRTILSDNRTAPEIAYASFEGIDPEIPIHIRPGSLASYQSRWTYFHNFIEDFPVGIDEPEQQENGYRLDCQTGLLTMDADTPLTLRIYDLNGRLVHSIAPTVHATCRLPIGMKMVLVQVGSHAAEKVMNTGF